MEERKARFEEQLAEEKARTHQALEQLEEFKVRNPNTSKPSKSQRETPPCIPVRLFGV